MAQTHILGYPRIGAHRELKFALEAFWRGEVDAAHLEGVARQLRAQNLAGQNAAGLTWRTVGDFAFYDPMLATTALLGCLPARFGFDAKALTLAQQFELARGNRAQPALEMTKWFDTNYHYLVPELDAHSTFDGGSDDWFAQIEEAHAYSTQVKPVLIGPVTYLHLAKTHQPGFDRLTLLDGLVAGYRRILARAAQLGVTWLQIDEPVLALELDARWLDAFDRAYAALRGAGPKLLLTTYFADASVHAARVAALPVDGVHVDLVAAPRQLDAWLGTLPAGRVLSVGVVNGRNIWRTDLRAALATLEPLQQRLGERLWVGTSCSLAHVPVSLAAEHRIDPELRSWLAFADEKIAELQALGRALAHGVAAAAEAFAASDAAFASRRASARVTDPAVRSRTAQVTPAMTTRAHPFAERIQLQHARLKLPLFPTTTIGSFPQTTEIRHLRAARRKGEIDEATYEAGMREQIRVAVERQESYGLDVLVHGEPERNDMAEYFGERLAGFAFTENGWVQSYGSRCVKPPVIYGDVSRPAPMTVAWTRYAQSLTDKPMKGMLTGPVTMLQWSFVRDDQPHSETCLQIALALRDEVHDLEAAGTPIIQLDEPAFREGLPLKRSEWDAYLAWAGRAFRIASSGVADTTQMHTHMCYSEFNDILPAIAALDADVITIETSRSAMELLEGFRDFHYPNEIGPGVYDIHSPRIPTVEAMVALLEKAAALIPAERLWVNPDCGLKTRRWPEVDAALANMVAAARVMRTRAAARS